MSILVVGSVAFDSIETISGKVDEVLGGSAVYFSLAASYFVPVNLVAVIGSDFPSEHCQLLASRNIDLRGLQTREGKTFRWKGRYGFDFDEAETLDTQLNVFKDFRPEIPQEYEESSHVFLANIDPELQSLVLEQAKKAKLIAGDTMNFWIDGKSEQLKETIKQLDILIINEGEARSLSGEKFLVRAAKKILSLGPKTLVIKQGGYGALMFSGSSVFSAPAFPLETIFDPTGAGDSFAGGFMGHLARAKNLKEETIRQAIIFGSVMASFNVEDFGVNRLKSLSFQEIENRYKEFKKLTYFEDI